MTAAAFLMGFLALCMLGSIVAISRQRSPLLWIILGCILLDGFALGFLFSLGAIQ